MRRDASPDSEADTKTAAAGASTEGFDGERYASIAAAARQVRTCATPGDPAASSAAGSILFLEARLLDARRYREWLDLLTPDYAYWIPGSGDIDDPRTESAINFDDHRRMIDRVALIETGSLHAQIPPSRACRFVSNIEAWCDSKDRMLVRSNLVIWEYRRGTAATFVGSQVHELVQTAASWAIRTRIISLIDCDEPQGNVTFIL